MKKPEGPWKSIYVEQPANKQVVASKISGEKGYHSNTIWDEKTQTFRTYEDSRNRFFIIIWKHDQWQENE